MKILLVILASTLILSCANNSGKQEESFNIMDSLVVSPELGKVTERTFQGLLPAASCPGIDYTLTLYNQEYSGDGVYCLTMRYIEAENGKDAVFTTYGRQYTLRGDATDPNATVYQLAPYDSIDVVNLLYIDNNLELINRNFERANSQLNYTLKLTSCKTL